MQKTVRKILRAVADHDPDYYDMHDDPNEQLFAQLYVERIVRHAEEAGLPAAPGQRESGAAQAGIRRPVTLLEAGCQAGRLVVPLARRGFQVTGIDTSGFALRRARAHAKAAGVEAEFLQGDLMRVIARKPERQFDVVVCAEVVYLSPKYREMLRALAGAVRPGGLLFVSHRPKFYYLLEAIRQYDLSAAASVMERSEGPFGDSAYYNWQTEAELRSLYESLGLRWVALHPIDHAAWMGKWSPGELSDAQRAQWLALELQLTQDAVGTCSRYVLVAAARPETGR